MWGEECNVAGVGGRWVTPAFVDVWAYPLTKILSANESCPCFSATKAQATQNRATRSPEREVSGRGGRGR